MTIPKVHQLPSTTVRFNPTATLLISGSADNTIVVISVPQKFGRSRRWFLVKQKWIGKLIAVTALRIIIAIIVAILAVLLAIATQLYLQQSGGKLY